jgi:hypothetical protein
MKPIMCAYKIVRVRFEVWGLQTRVEDFTQRVNEFFNNPSFIPLSILYRLYVIFSFLHIDKHLHGWMNGEHFIELIYIF